jgi:hypothetical protein
MPPSELLLSMASLGNYFKLKSSMLKLFGRICRGATGASAEAMGVYYDIGE